MNLSVSARQGPKHSLWRNVTLLYGLQLVSFLFPLVTVPYLSRVLLPEKYGFVLYAQSLAAWFGLFIEYGFALSATRSLAQCRDNAHARERTVAAVQSSKLLLVLGSALVVPLSVALFPIVRTQPILALLAWLLAVAQGLHPLWYFQGLERMAFPSAVDAGANLLAIGLTLGFVHTPNDGLLFLLILVATRFCAVILTTVIMYREVPVRRAHFSQVRAVLAEGFSMFFFKSSVSLYSAANAMILGMFASPAQVAFYSSAERIAKGALTLLQPLTQVVFPRMSQLVRSDIKSAHAVLKWSFFVTSAVGSLSALGLGLFAEPIIRLVLGESYLPAVPVLRILALLLPVIAVSSVLGLQYLVPSGRDRSFNTVIACAGLMNVSAAAILARKMAASGMAFSVVLAEFFVTACFVVLAAKLHREQKNRVGKSSETKNRVAALSVTET